MSSFISTPSRLIQTSLIIAISAVFNVACSSSSSSDSQASIDNNLDASPVSAVTNDDVVDNSSNSSVNSSTNNLATNTPDDITDVSTNDNPIVMTDDTEVLTADLAAVMTRVDIEITVPVYVSNSLQVKLTWGDRELSAGWEIDETWRVVEDFPSDTTNLLRVDFLDRNGAIVLGTYETDFRTSTSPTETLAINADQFDTNQWDNDGDGVSNLDELISGTDPLALPDPSTQNLVRVDFGITVPALVSDELQVLLVWGDEEIEAAWAGDESWSAFADLPIDTTEPLTVTFSDRNGDLPLGSYETTYQTGNNGAEYLQIESRQININRFDNDIDGVSNFSELLAETDPDVSDSVVTFTSVKSRFRGCGNCHTNYRTADTLHEVLLNQVNRDDEPMVTPFEPEDSYLVNKLEGSMLRFGGTSLAQLVRAWITTGALDN